LSDIGSFKSASDTDLTLTEKECNEINNENIYVETRLERVNDKEELLQKKSFLDQSSEKHVEMETGVDVTRDMDGEAKEDRKIDVVQESEKFKLLGNAAYRRRDYRLPIKPFYQTDSPCIRTHTAHLNLQPAGSNHPVPS